MDHAGWVDHQVAGKTLVQHLNEVYVQEILDKRPEWTQHTARRSIERLSAVLSEATSVIGSVVATHKRGLNNGLPIHRLPPETLFRIFQMASHEHTPWCQRRYSDVPEPLPWMLLAISHTCSHWRNVSLTFPKLWSKLHADRMPQKLVSLFCERSGNCPLTLEFEYSKLWSTPSNDTTIEAQRAREDHLGDLWTRLHDRVRSFCYNPMDKTDTVGILTRTTCHPALAHLEELELSREAKRITEELPNLRRLNLAGAGISNRTASSLKNLTDLTLRGEGAMRSKILQTIVSASTVLQAINLTFPGGFVSEADGSGFESSPIVHHRLASVTLQLPSPSVNLFLRSFALPSFTRLDVVNNKSPDFLHIEANTCIPDSVSWLHPACVNRSMTDVTIDQDFRILKIWFKSWASTDRRQQCLVTMTITSTHSRRLLKLSMRETLEGVALVLPKLRGHNSSTAPTDSTRGSRLQSSSLRSSTRGVHQVSLPRICGVEDWRELAAAVASLNIARLEFTSISTPITAERLQSFANADDALRDLSGKTLAFTKCYFLTCLCVMFALLQIPSLERVCESSSALAR